MENGRRAWRLLGIYTLRLSTRVGLVRDDDIAFLCDFLASLGSLCKGTYDPSSPLFHPSALKISPSSRDVHWP